MVAVLLRVGTRQGVFSCFPFRHGENVLTNLDLLSWAVGNRDSRDKLKATLKQAPHSRDHQNIDAIC